MGHSRRDETNISAIKGQRLKTIRTYIAFLSYRSPGPGYITEITESKVAARIKGAQISTLARNNLRQEE
ncbi:hypothetical protein Y032_0002g738 [Ancylostoma ceylanicum]|uniref:Uncharacterized protein n=1 Tax=Ancylostoma ceylanicum TaxID=53326 RepID=A0A016W2X3_9BILA|nr:hypothetical protein Y032_0002g738 [Ancylostoma ceylanicum]